MSRVVRALLSVLGALVVAVSLAACGSSDGASPATASSGGGAGSLSSEPLKVGASPVPHAEILDYVAKSLAPKAGLKLDVVTYDDYVQPNVALQEKQLDVNYFQHKPYLEQQIKDNPAFADFVALAPVHLEPLGVYSRKVTELGAVRDGATVTLSNDPANEARGLKLLQQAKVITLKPGAELDATPQDIAANPKHLTFKTIAPANLPRTLDDADLAVINGNYALEAGLKPAQDALAIESASDNPYANLLVARRDDVNDPRIRKLEQLLHSPQVKQFIQTKYQGSVIVAF
jgi:D-methionine transport system substrate-binding protein